MIVAKDAYSIKGVRNAALHRYYDSIVTWSRLWQVFLEPKPRIGKRSSYQILAGQDQSSLGVIDYASPVGKALRLWKVWPTNAVPYLRNWDDATGSLPPKITNDRISITLLAYQIWLLRPENILVLGPANGETIAIVHQALGIASVTGFELPAIYRVPHSSGSPFFVEGPIVLEELRAALPSPYVTLRKRVH